MVVAVAAAAVAVVVRDWQSHCTDTLHFGANVFIVASSYRKPLNF